MKNTRIINSANSPSAALKKRAGGIYKFGALWILNFPAPLGVTEHPTFRAAVMAARKSGLAPKRWFNCDADAEVAS